MSPEDIELLAKVLPGWAVQKIDHAVNLTELSEQQQQRRRLAYIEGTKSSEEESKLEYKIAPLSKHLWGQQASKQCIVCHGCKHVSMLEHHALMLADCVLTKACPPSRLLLQNHPHSPPSAGVLPCQHAAPTSEAMHNSMLYPCYQCLLQHRHHIARQMQQASCSPQPMLPQVLQPMPTGTEMLGSYFVNEQGASPAWLFRMRDKRARSGWSVVKVWCIPLMKAKQRGLAKCAPKNIIRQIKLLTAQQKVTAECGLQDIVPKLWMEGVDGVVPGEAPGRALPLITPLECLQASCIRPVGRHLPCSRCG